MAAMKIGVVFLCAMCALLGVDALGNWKALDSEQALFAYTRCQEDHLPSGSSRADYFKSWTQWKLEPNDATTHCYVKCVLEQLGLYDGKDKKFRSKRVTIQHDAYKSINGADAGEVAKYKQAVAVLNPGSDSCADVYNAYLPVHKQFVDVTRKLYHGTVEGAAKVYEANPNIKRKGESYFAFCEKRAYGDDNKEDLCKARKYELTGSPQLKKDIDCIFRGLRYIDDNGLNVDEIVRDFKLVNKADRESKVRSVLSACNGSNAYGYYACLVNSELKEDFKEAFDFREVRSANYAYLTLGNVYDAAKVKADVAKSDASAC